MIFVNIEVTELLSVLGYLCLDLSVMSERHPQRHKLHIRFNKIFVPDTFSIPFSCNLTQGKANLDLIVRKNVC
jgi:hypothetical protein